MTGMISLPRTRLAVKGLQLFWTLLAVWYEHVVFIYHVGRCVWPDSDIAPTKASARPTHVLLVADPQILDHRSYPGRAPSLTYISQLLVDLNLRKSWRAALRTRPDVVVFLGDMMDGGRFSMSDAEYEEYFQRFQSIFPLDQGIPRYFIPGNHDTGLGISDHFSKKAGARYESHFGPLNSHVTISNHTIIFLDATSLVEEDLQRLGQGNTYRDWPPVPGGSVEFVQQFSKSGNQDPIMLFTHIPLSRPDGASCGPSRERGTIRRGAGFGYQNTLGKATSEFLLSVLRPSVVFSGDDHDYCEYTHSLDNAGMSIRAREVTVKSMSMAMGIRRPGFQLLSLVPPHSSQGRFSHADSLCLLPDQLGIYLATYIPFLVLSLFIIFSANIHRICSRRKGQRRTALSLATSPSSTPLSGVLRSRRPIDSDEWLQYPSETDADILPRPTSSLSTKAPRPMYSQTFVLFGRRRRITIGTESLASLFRSVFSCCGNQDVPKSRGFAAGVLYDVRDVAVFPLAIFGAFSWWMFR
ncbi:Metallo-dependent phosphatase-like protein [Mycena belliarum]|uniref:Metallo-dependent phosphatase-like protein n=1 Tax=Mycena belliarum TaxID=1033014 RepID=A0AAD6TS17_9AGAR|nr:Metallo-dependent phosphatase-like protein [Mycena belliae]